MHNIKYFNVYILCLCMHNIMTLYDLCAYYSLHACMYDPAIELHNRSIELELKLNYAWTGIVLCVA